MLAVIEEIFRMLFAPGVWACVKSDGDRRTALFEGFLRVRPIPRLSLGAEGVVWLRDLPATDDYLATITGAAGYFIVDPLGVFVAVDGQLFGSPTAQQLPGLDDVRVRVIGAVQF